MSKRELLQMAFDALDLRCGSNADEQKVLIPALRAELAKPEPVPTGWYDPFYKDFSHVNRIGWEPLYRKEDV